MKVFYDLAIGGWSVNSANDARAELLELETILAFGGVSDVCRLTVYALPAPQAGLLEQAAGEAIGAATGALGLGGGGGAAAALTTQVRGQDIHDTDQITIKLTAGDISETVMTAEVESARADFGRTTLIGRTGAQKLARARLNQIYQNQTLRQIVQDLAGQAGAQTGDVEVGGTYPYFVVQEAKNLWTQIRELGMREGCQVYFDTENRLTLKRFAQASANHILRYGAEILELEWQQSPPTASQVRVYGESPSSSKGADTWHWLAKDLTPFRAEVGQSGGLHTFSDSALRAKDAADRLATAKFGALKDQATRARVKTLGNPRLKLGDSIEIQSAPKPELNGNFTVTSVRHLFSKRDGYVTWTGLMGQGGAAQAGGLLGQAAGQITGALGL